MKIRFVEIQNYRKLKSCRIELSPQKTVFVGANNGGKTAAMDAMLKFLTRKAKFSVNDITVSNWIEINKIGEQWKAELETAELFLTDLRKLMPTFDLWLDVPDNQIHYVTHLLPTLDWNGELIGVRLILEPKDITEFYKSFHREYSRVHSIISSRCKPETETKAKLWPQDMYDFLSRKMFDLFTLKAYLLDPQKLHDVVDGIAFPQDVSDDTFLEKDPLHGLISIKSINAQRGFSDPDVEDAEGTVDHPTNLSSQLRRYYNKHIDPEKMPDEKDLDALDAIEVAQGVFDEKLNLGFSDAIKELTSLGYPGFTDPKITISTKVHPVDALKHDSAVQYSLVEGEDQIPKLPERYNGLGYQNLISMVFKLINFRDEWMCIGKAASEEAEDDYIFRPLQLVLIEEPEAHLHAQVQQVFIRKAYDVLRNRPQLGESTDFLTQLVVSTHSSYIAYAVEFKDLRYFRREPANDVQLIPTSKVVNLCDVFGKEDKTAKFVTRYLKTTHCDLFFADAAILIEGPAERMMIPHFIENHSGYKTLSESYITILEIGGSYAHLLKPLIELLGLTTLVITDLDAGEKDGHHKSSPAIRGQELVTNNATLKKWLPQKNLIDDLLDIPEDAKEKRKDSCLVRVAYQMPVMVDFDGDLQEVIPNTFEDSFVCHNVSQFRKLSDAIAETQKDPQVDVPTVEGKLTKSFLTAARNSKDAKSLQYALFDSLDKYGSKKAEFILDLLFRMEPQQFDVPNYIAGGLTWLSKTISERQRDKLPEMIKAAKGCTGEVE